MAWPVEFNPNDYKDKEECKNVLLNYLRNASRSKDICPEPKPSAKDLAKVQLVSYAASREEILGWVQADIDKFQQELAVAKKIRNPTDRKLAEINAINHFIRKLHQTHYFPDGNGRTFVFLLANLLLLQNGHGLKITEHPAHYAAYSSEELLQETLHDMKHFDEYKITNAKKYLANLNTTTIYPDGKEAVTKELLSRLSADPLIAMAQISELHAQIDANELIVPKNYSPDHYWFTAIAYQGSKLAHFRVLNLLTDAYESKLAELVENVSEVDEDKRIGHGSKESPGEVLKSVLSNHKITEFCNRHTIDQLIQKYDEQIQPRSSKV